MQRFGLPLVTYVFGLILTLAVHPARAEIHETSDEIADSRAKRMLELAASSRLHFPGSLRDKNDLFLLITASGAAVDIRALGSTSQPPQRIGDALAKGLQGHPFANLTVEWNHGDEFSAARADYSAGRMFARSATVDVPVGTLCAQLRSAGFTVHTCLRIPKNLKAPQLPVPTDRTGANYTWYAFDEISSDASVHLEDHLSSLAVAASLMFFLFVPVVGGCSLLAAILIGKSSKLPLERRRSLYVKIAQRPTFAAIALHAPFVILYLWSSYARSLADIWFGSTRITSTSPLLMAPLLVLPLILPLSYKVEKRLFGRSAPQADEVQVSDEERIIRQRMGRWLLVPVVLFFAITALGAFVFSSRTVPVMQISFVIAFLVQFVGQQLVLRRFKQQLQRFNIENESSDLLVEARALGAQVGTSIAKVIVDGSVQGRRYAAASASRTGTIRVTQKCLDSMTPAEMRFLLAHEVAHVSSRHFKSRLILFLCGFLLFGSPMIVFPLIISTKLRPNPAAVFPLMMAGFAVLFFGLRAVTRKQEFESDAKALELTGDLDSAESALMKLMEHSPMPHIHEHAENSTHPKMSRRVAALRRAAKLKLSDQLAPAETK